MWFEDLMGFREESGDQVRANIHSEGESVTSRANGKQYQCGRLEIPSLAELRSQSAAIATSGPRLAFREVVGDVQQLHQDSRNAGALFQVASQFNLLEMLTPSRTPDDGVAIYELDRTQGPACAIACGAGTIFRNYFADTNGKIGQTAENQIDCLNDIGVALDNAGQRLWKMQNGYALATKAGLAEITDRLTEMNDQQRDDVRQHLRVGVQWRTQVTLGANSHTVTQLYGSALPVAYSNHGESKWEAFATLVLEASYEATLHAAAINCAQGGSNKVFLTLLGGGAFGNQYKWIFRAIRRLRDLDIGNGLDVAIVSYGQSNQRLRDFILSNH